MNLNGLSARDVMPCFNEPDLVADFKIHVIRPKEYKVMIGAGFQRADPFSKTASTSDPRKFGVTINVNSHEWDTFDIMKSISPDQIGFVIGPFQTEHDQLGEQYVAVSSSDDNDKAQRQYLVQVMKQTLSLFQPIINNRLDYKVLRTVIMPDYKDDQNHPRQLLIISQRKLQQLNMVQLMQYFGEMIMKELFSIVDDWSSMWQATGLRSGIVEYILRKKNFINDADYIIKREAVLNFDLYTTIRSILPIYSKENEKRYDFKVLNETFINNALQWSTAPKWSSIIATLLAFASTQISQTEINNILRDQTNSSFLEEESGNLFDSLKLNTVDYLKPWTQRSFPFLQVDTMISDISIAQYCLIDNQVKNATDNWKVPIQIKTDDSSDYQTHLIDTQRTDISTSRSSMNVLFDPYLMSNYRVLYTKSLQDLIIKTIETKTQLTDRDEFMTPLQRAVFYNDLAHFCRVGLAEYDQLFRLTASLPVERSDAVWAAALSSYEWLYRLMGADTDTRESKWISDFLEPKLKSIFNELGLEAIDDEQQLFGF